MLSLTHGPYTGETPVIHQSNFEKTFLKFLRNSMFHGEIYYMKNSMRGQDMFKKCIYSFAVLLIVSIILPADFMVANAATYYVSLSSGNDGSNGTSTTAPWKTLAKVAQTTYSAGDQILLKSGDTWNECLTINTSGNRTSFGTPANPILVSSYGTGEKPKINRNKARLEACIKIYEASGWKFTNLDIGNADYGIDLNYHTTGNQYVWIENCYFHDIDGTDYFGRILPDQAEYSYSAGVAISGGKYSAPNVTDLTIQNCNSVNVKTIFDPQMYNWDTQKTYDVKNVTLKNIVCTGGSWGWTLHDVDGALVDSVRAISNGTSYFQVGAAAGVVQNSRDILIQNCDFGFTQYVGTDGVAFDLEGRCSNVCVVNCNIFDAEENGVLWFNDGGSNWNCGMFNCNMIRCGYGGYSANTGMKLISSGDVGCIVEYVASDKATSWAFSSSFRQECNYTFGTTPPSLPTTGYPLTYNDTSSYVVFSGTSNGGAVGDLADGTDWTSITRSGEYNNDLHYTTITGAWVQFTFVGTGIDFIGPQTNNSGNVEIQLDGTTVATVNCYAATYAAQQVLYSNTGLVNGLHNIKVIKLSGAYMNADAFKVYRDSSATPTPVADPTDVNARNGKWEFNQDGNNQGWDGINNVSKTFPVYCSAQGGFLNGTITGTDPYLVSGVTNIPAATKKLVYVRMKNSTSSTTANIYFITTTDGNWNAAKSKTFTIIANDTGCTLYTIDMGTVAGWAGTINQMRIDPEEGIGSGTFSIDYIRVGDNTTGILHNSESKSMNAIRRMAVANTVVRFSLEYDAQITMLAYSFAGQVLAKKEISAHSGVNTMNWNALRTIANSSYLLALRIDKNTHYVYRVVKL